MSFKRREADRSISAFTQTESHLLIFFSHTHTHTTLHHEIVRVDKQTASRTRENTFTFLVPARRGTAGCHLAVFFTIDVRGEDLQLQTGQHKPHMLTSGQHKPHRLASASIISIDCILCILQYICTSNHDWPGLAN